MIAVIFEVEPHDEHRDAYFDTAARIRPFLEEIDGFISVERFQSLVNPGKILSLSFFEHETALEAWRNLEAHRAAQEAGRNGYFRDYRLRIASVIRDYGMTNREEAPEDSLQRHDQ